MPLATEIPAHPNRLKVLAKSPDVRVDREAKAIFGYVVAQEGPFKSEDRGEFDLKSLKSIVALMNKNSPRGTRSRFTHPNMSADALGTHLGRAKNPRIDQVRLKRDGEWVLLNAVRADLYFDDSAFKTPNGDLAGYVMDLAESDSDALSSSVVIAASTEEQLDPKTKRPILDASGNPKPPLWRPMKIFASDIVDTGDAVDGLLSAGLTLEGLPDELVRKATEMLDGKFAACDRETTRARLLGFVDHYLAYAYPDHDGEAEKATAETLTVEQARRRMAALGIVSPK